MTTDVVTLSPDTTVKQAAAVLAGRNIASAPVVDSRGAVVGIISEIDLLERDVLPDPTARLSFASAAGRPPRTVADVMTTGVITLPPEADAAAFLGRMLTDRVVCIPVTDD